MSKEKPSVVKLSSLVKSVRNVRTVAVPLGGLPSSIMANGLYMPLLVTEIKKGNKPTGRYAVEAGGRRLEALQFLLEDKKITGDYLVKVSVIDEADAVNASLVENFEREQMHPYDEFEAFKRLFNEGHSIEHIANVFGIGELHVKRRLRLANASEQILDEFKQNNMTLEQLMALCLTEDTERQNQVWFGATQSWEKSANRLRSAIVTDEVPVTTKTVAFIGLDAYLAAGGQLRQDLFSAELGQGDTVLDVALLDKLVQDKLSIEADKVQAEGWGWIEFGVDFDYDYIQKFGRLQKSKRDLTADEEAQMEALKVRRQAHEAAEQDLNDKAEETDEDYTEEWAALNAEEQSIIAEQALLNEAITVWPETKSIAGVFLSIGNDGIIQRREGLLRASDVKALQSENDATNGQENSADAGKKGLSDSLKSNLMAHRTGALQVHVANAPHTALALLTHRLALQTFGAYYRYAYANSIVKISPNTTELHKSIPDFEESPVSKGLQAIADKWLEVLPKDSNDLMDWLLNQPLETVMSLMAYCTSRSVDVTFESATPSYKKIGAIVNLDAHAWWQPSADNYFKRVSKEHMIEVVSEAGCSIGVDIAKMKKSELAEKAAETIKDSNWLPALLVV